ncbi:MAG: OmpH family outer membrane protein [Bacteroidales bacterium]|nr:OmpH family outer membrane protein [Bacteroidales bacterium]
MKSVSYIINGVLAVAIGVLYYFHFSSNKSSSNQEVLSASITGGGFQSGVVYLNIDTVLQEYDMYYEFKTQLEAKQKKLENELNTKTRAWEREAADFQDKVQKGLLLRSQAQELQQKLGEEQQNLLMLREQMSYELAEEEQVMNRQLIHSIMEYLKEYNKGRQYQYILGTSFGGNILYANDSLDITKEVLKGLNEKYIEDNPKEEDNK